MMLILILLALLVMAGLYTAWQRLHGPERRDARPKDDVLDVLRRQYEAGTISRDEYEQMKQNLG